MITTLSYNPQQVSCPTCDAMAGDLCIKKDGTIKISRKHGVVYHKKRYIKYVSYLNHPCSKVGLYAPPF